MRTRCSICLCLLIAWCTSASAQAPTQSATVHPPVPSPQAIRAAKLFERAVALQQKGRTEEAITVYRELIRLAPKAYPAYMNLGLLYQNSRRLKEAEEAFRKASALEPANALPLSQLATVYADEHRWAEAKTAALAALKRDPKSAAAHFALGGCLIAAGRLQAAEEQFRLAARYSPGNARAQFNLGIVLAREKRYPQALAALGKALELDPKLVEAHVSMGVIHQLMGEPHKALAAYEKAAKFVPRNGALLYNMAGAYQAMAQNTGDRGLLQKALSLYLQAIAAQPAMVPAHLNAARIYFEMRNYPQAVRYFRSALALAPTNPRILADLALAETWAANSETDAARRKAAFQSAEDHYRKAIALKAPIQAYEGLGYLYQQLARNDAAEDIYKRAVARFPTDSGGYLALARLREAQTRIPEAIAQYQKALQVDPNSTDARLALGRIFQTQNKLDAAEKIYREWVAAAPSNPNAHRLLAQTYLNEKKTDLAIAQFQELRRLAPKDVSAVISLASAYEQAGRYDDAVKTYELVRTINPGNVTGLWYIAQLMERQKRYDDAIARYREIEAISPGNPFYEGNIPRILQLQGKTDAAIAEYRRLAEKEPTNTVWHTQLADLFEKQNKWADAAAQYAAIVDANPKAAWAWIKLGKVYHNTGLVDKACDAFLHAAADPTYTYEAYTLLAAAYTSEHKLADWVTYLKNHIAQASDPLLDLTFLRRAEENLGKTSELADFLKPLAAGKLGNNRAFLTAVAGIFEKLGRNSEALDLYRKAAAMAPDDYTAWANEAALLEKMGSNDAAIEDYQHILGIKNVPPVVLAGYRVKLARLYEASGRKTMAIGQYKEALKNDPNNAEAKEAVKRLGG